MWVRAVLAIALTCLAGCSSGVPDRPEGHTVDETSVVAPTNALTGIADGPARAYVDAVNARNLDALVASFAEHGEVVDVTRRIKGHQDVRAWAANEVMGGTLEVREVTSTAVGQDLLVHWAPSGSTGWKARYRFTFAGDKIGLADLQYA